MKHAGLHRHVEQRLVRAARLAEADGRWSAEALRRALLTEAQPDRILTEILDGEEAINAQASAGRRSAA